MKIITRDTDYAIRALICLASSKRDLVTVKELSAELDIPGPFLRKIFQALNRHGIMRSFKGKSGGFSLTHDINSITVFSLVEIFQGSFCLNEHLFKGKICPMVRTCFLKKRLDSIEKDVIKKLKAINIGDLARKGAG